MKRMFFWALGFLIFLAVGVTAILGGGFHLDTITGSIAPEETPTEPDPISMTLWSDQAELFLEYPPFVAGHPSIFVAHLTDLRNFRPVIAGTVEVRMTTKGQPALSFLASAPLRPGIFTPSVTLSEPGTYEMELSLKSDALNETFHIANVEVFPSVNEVERQTAAPESLDLQEEVTFLKEQQWKVEFATQTASNQILTSTIRARGVITPKMGQKVVVTAPATGLVVLSATARIPIIGQEVEKGEILVAITPGLSTASRAELESAVSQAVLQQAQAQRELHRAERLFKEKVLAKKQVEQANTTFLLAKNKHAEVQKRLASLTLAQQVGRADTRDETQDYLLRAPIQGIILKADLTLGSRVEAGEELFTLINMDHVWVEARVYGSDVSKISHHARASFRPQGMTELILSDQVNSRLVAIGNVIDTATKTLPVIFEVENPTHRLKVGMHADVFIETGEKSNSVIIPSTAVLQETGKKVAFVQTGGETFEKRFITTSSTTSRKGEEMVQILEGIEAAERVVSKGAYAIRLAAASGEIPTHAH
ncbi:efflux RND transporter periplasmic adaptor subunit [Nitrospira sp. T9]|uniref:efflux RND transporter periplasmic adaptor subunit n=1 Tax=unclassified Nitrospira TaxID=2652172 RepID=UPI003F9573D3